MNLSSDVWFPSLVNIFLNGVAKMGLFEVTDYEYDVVFNSFCSYSRGDLSNLRSAYTILQLDTSTVVPLLLVNIQIDPQW